MLAVIGGDTVETDFAVVEVVECLVEAVLLSQDSGAIVELGGRVIGFTFPSSKILYVDTELFDRSCEFIFEFSD